MPIRGSYKNFLAAAKAPFAKRFGLLTNVDNVDKDFDNDYALTWSNAANTSSVTGIKLDASDRVNIGYNVVKSTPKVVRFNFNANTGIGDQCIWIADQAYEVLGAWAVFSVAGSDASAVTMDITRDPSGTAPGAGTSVIASTFNMKATANTVQTVGPATTRAAITIAAGDRLSLNFTGTLTALEGVVVEVLLSAGYAGDQAIFALNANGSLADQCFYTATKNMQISRIDYVHSVLGTNGSAVNLQITKDTGTDAPGAGTDLLTNNSNAGFNCKAAINTVQNGTLSATAANLRLAPGDRLSADFAGTLTALAGVVVVVTFTPYFETFDINFNLTTNASLVDQCIFIANRPLKVLFCSEVHATAGTDGSAVNMQLTLDRGTDAPGAGSNLISLNSSAGFDMKGTANTVQNATFISDGLNYMLPGDRLSLDFAGTITSLAGVQLTVTFAEA